MPNKPVRSRRRAPVPQEKTTAEWVERELAGCRFKDERLGKRFRMLLEQLGDATGESIPMACQDWANTKAAYRFFSNGRVNEAAILHGHFQATHRRVTATDGPILVLHDTTEFVYDRENIGLLSQPALGKVMEGGIRRHHTVCGILMHSSLAVTPEGLPLGLAGIKFWTRQQFKGTNALRNKINATRVSIEKKESFRWIQNLRQSTLLLNEAQRCVHIGDRESDIYELFSAAQKLNTHFLVRTCVNRLANDGEVTVQEEMEEVPVKGLHRIEVRNKKGEIREAVLELRYRRIKVLAPVAKQNRYPPLTLTVIHAQERDAPKDCELIDWKLITDLPVTSCTERSRSSIGMQCAGRSRCFIRS